jgi:hypothetical protein
MRGACVAHHATALLFAIDDLSDPLASDVVNWNRLPRGIFSEESLHRGRIMRDR